MQFIKKTYLILYILFFTSCAYYNTFFNAEESFRLAREKQLSEKSGKKISSEVKKNYEKAIKKSWKVIDLYGDSSTYADDALFLIGKSHFNLEEYPKAERVLEQFLLKYTDSEFVPEARLWLARTYVKLDKDDKALDQLNILNKENISSRLASEAEYILGELYFKREQYPEAITHFEKAIDLSSDEILIGGALYQSGEAYLILNKYEEAIDKFDRVAKLDIPPQKEFEARMKSINAIIQLKDYQEAEKRLKKMHRQKRFEKQFAEIDTRLANLAEYEGNYEFAADSYYEVLEKYPRTEGASMASFYLAKLYEYYFNNPDSAKAYYDNVRKQFARSDSLRNAEKHAKLLAEYLKLRNQINKDKDDLYRLSIGDSALVDSVDFDGSDSTKTTETDNNKTAVEKAITDASKKDKNIQQALADQAKSDKKGQKSQKTKKKAVPRDPAKVEASLKKNSFALGEFFLLKYENYDSAAVAYQNFVENFEDSLLVPKAYYSLYYIYNNIKKEDKPAEKYKSIILTEYPNTIYAKKLLGVPDEKSGENNRSPKDHLLKEQYQIAEDYIDAGRYEDAIQLLNRIAESDTNSVWAQKSRFAIAYIYETKMNNIPLAVNAYSVVANLYPGTPFGKIAKNKIKKPKVEQKEQDSTSVVLSSDSLTSNTATPDSLKKGRSLEKDRKLPPGINEKVKAKMGKEVPLPEEEEKVQVKKPAQKSDSNEAKEPIKKTEKMIEPSAKPKDDK